jgi:hypothetical protein
MLNKDAGTMPLVKEKKNYAFLPSFLPAKERVIERSDDRVSQLCERYTCKFLAYSLLTPTTLRSSTLSSLRGKKAKNVLLLNVMTLDAGIASLQ